MLTSRVDRCKPFDRRPHLEALALLALSCGNHPTSPRVVEPLPHAVLRSATPPIRTHTEAPVQKLSLNAGIAAIGGSGISHPVLPTTADEEAARVPIAVDVTTDRVEIDQCRDRPAGSVAAAAADEQLQTWNTGGSSDPSHISNRSGYHPGTRVLVDVTASGTSRKGHSRVLRIQADLRKRGYWRFRNCYEDLARDKKEPGGKTWLRATIGAKGSVLSVKLVRTDLLLPAIAQCHSRALRGLHVEPTGAKSLVEVQVSVWPGDVALLPLPNCAAKTSSVETTRFTAIVESIQPKVAECMQSARMRDPDLWGRLALSFVVGEDGRASALQESYSQFGDAVAIGCVREQLRSVELPRPNPTFLRLVASWRLHRPSVAQPPQATTDQPNQTKADPSIGSTSSELSTNAGSSEHE
jgi:hypothetical protein